VRDEDDRLGYAVALTLARAELSEAAASDGSIR